MFPSRDSRGETQDATWAFAARTVRKQVERLAPQLVLPGEVEDRVAEILLSLVRKGRAWPSTIDNLEAYLWVVVRNACSHPLERGPKGLRVYSLERLAELGQAFAAPESAEGVEEGSEPGEGAGKMPEHLPRDLVLELCLSLPSPARRVLVRRLADPSQGSQQIASKIGLSAREVR